MSMKPVRERAEELLALGHPKQETFDRLVLEFPAAKPKRVAKILRYKATEQDQQRFRDLHIALLSLVLLNAVLRLLPKVLDQDVDWSESYRFVSLVPIASLLVGYSLYRWQGQVFLWVGWANVLAVFGLVRALSELTKGSPPDWALAVEVSSVLIGAMALYLANKVFQKYEVQPDPSGNGTKRYLFREEQRGFIS